MVDHVNKVGGAGGVVPQKKLRGAFGADGAARADSVEISSDVMRLQGMKGIRLDKVMEVRRAIASGTYLTAEKVDKALNGAIDEALGVKRAK